MTELRFRFPLPRVHTGVVLGNGVQGLMVWGDRELVVTVGRAGFWDHRGGNRFAARTTFAEVRRLLEANDHATLRQRFARPDARPGQPDRPHQVGCGRIAITCSGWAPDAAELDTATQRLRIRLHRTDGAPGERWMAIAQAVDLEYAVIDLPADLDAAVTCRPTWDFVGEQLASVGVTPPRELSVDGGGGWLQTLPEDDPLALVWRREGSRIMIATALGGDAAAQATARLATDRVPALTRAAAFAEAYAADLPSLQLPDQALQRVWDYGLHKQAALTPEHGVACSLQGPFLEDYQLPPWSCDYHFNINVQMIYGPCLATGRAGHLRPLWRMIDGWMPHLREGGRSFFGRDDALMLPHAVDDRCAAVGTFWTGMIDHACTAWMALLATRHWRFTGEREVLERTAWPLLTGALAGYEAMLEERGGTLSLPVSVSPEWRGCREDAWGRDASFQLAALHAVLRALPQAAAALGRPVDPRWAATAARLPAYSMIEGPRILEYPEQRTRRIALWDGMDLVESHRHHSHLAAIWPFQTIDPADPAHAGIVRNSLNQWVLQGPGRWSGWGTTWAAILCARAGWADGAVTWLRWWRDVFCNVGGGTLHDGGFHGATTLVATGEGQGHSQEIMQMDAAMGAIEALCELLVHERPDGVMAVLPALPQGWSELSFDRIRGPGGVAYGATVERGRLREVRLSAERDATVRLALSGTVREVRLGAGERVALAV